VRRNPAGIPVDEAGVLRYFVIDVA
jgi:hypothetical protein